MTTLTAHLPANNVWPRWTTDLISAERVGGPDCLSVPGDGQGVLFHQGDGGVFVGAIESEINPGHADSSGEALGFGLFELPPAATLISVRFAGVLEFVGSVEAIPEGWVTELDVVPAMTQEPFLAIDYDGRSPFPVLGYALGPPDVTVTPPDGSIEHLLFDGDYVIAGIGTPDTGTFGLCPLVYNVDPYWRGDGENLEIFLSYLEIQVTYELAGGIAPGRLWPRADGLGILGGRIWPRDPSQQSGRLTGYV